MTTTEMAGIPAGAFQMRCFSLAHHRRLGFAPRIAAQGPQHTKEMQDQSGQDQRRVPKHHREEPHHPLDDLPRVELAKTRQEETQHGGQAGAPEPRGRLIDHDQVSASRAIAVDYRSRSHLGLRTCRDWVRCQDAFKMFVLLGELGDFKIQPPLLKGDLLGPESPISGFLRGCADVVNGLCEKLPNLDREPSSGNAQAAQRESQGESGLGDDREGDPESRQKATAGSQHMSGG